MQAYRSFDSLLGEFKTRLSTFLVSQHAYLALQSARAAAHRTGPVKTEFHAPSTFSNLSSSSSSSDALGVSSETHTCDRARLVFTFEGEFSVVADPAGGEVASRIEGVRGVVAKALGLDFVYVVFLLWFFFFAWVL